MGTNAKFFSSEQLGAPTLSGTPGDMIAVLDAVLANGFGVATPTSIVVASNVATVSYGSAHPYKVGSVMSVTGATPGGLNGEKRVTSMTTLTASFATTGIADLAATGTISTKVAPAGWSKAFAGTNLAAYKMLDVTGTGCYLRVDDTGTTNARVRGYESMPDVNTGNGPFPSTGQMAGAGLYISKSNATSASVRPWRVFADSRSVYIFVKNGDTLSEYQGSFFGDLLPLRSNDPYACGLAANSNDIATAYTAQSGPWYTDNTMAGMITYLARAANALGGSTPTWSAPCFNAGVPSSGMAGSVGGMVYPSPVDNGLLLTPAVAYGVNHYRGYYPGISLTPQLVNTSFSTDDIIPGTGDMAGKSLRAVKVGGLSGVNLGIVFFDVSSDWR